MTFKNHVVLITGSSRGIGAAIAKSFAQEGASVIVNYLQNKEAAEQVVSHCQKVGGDAFAIQADVADEKAVQKMVEQIELEFGTLHTVVNNAFAPYRFDPEQRKLYSEVAWDDYETQLKGAVQACHYVNKETIPIMRKNGEGSIIHMVTNLIARPVVPYHEYTTAKSALLGYSRNLAADLGPFGIRVNCVAPGLVYPTDASKYTKEKVKNDLIAQTPLRRLAQPEDVAGPVLFLSSEWAKFITGQTITVDGGLVMN